VACRKISKLFCHNSCRLLLARSSATYTLFSIFFPPCCLSHRERYYQSTRRVPVARVQPYLDLLSRGIPGSLSSFLPVSMVIHVGRKLGELIVMYAMKLRFSLSFFCSLFLGDSWTHAQNFASNFRGSTFFDCVSCHVVSPADTAVDRFYWFITLIHCAASWSNDFAKRTIHLGLLWFDRSWRDTRMSCDKHLFIHIII